MKTNRFSKRATLFILCSLAVTLLVTHMFAVGVFADEPVPDGDEQKQEEVQQDNDEKAQDDKSEENDTKEEDKKDSEEKDSEKKESEDKESKEKKSEDTPVANYEHSDGFLDKLAIPFGFVIKVCYDLIPNYAIALLLFAIAMKVVLFPFGIKQQKNSVKQASLRPKEMAIRKKYAGRTDKVTQQKMQQEIMDLYQKENFNPMGGCLPLLLQFPILFALFRVVYNPLRYICGLSVDKINEIGNKLISSGAVKNAEGNLISAIDFRAGDLNIATLLKDDANREIVADLLPKNFELPDLTFIGIDLSKIPTLDWNLLIIIPIATFVVVYGTTWLTRKLTYQPEQTADMKTSSRIMDLVMPAMSTWFTFMYPAVLGLYWIFQNILGVVQQLVLKKMYPLPKFSEEDYAQAEKEVLGKGQNKKKKTGSYKRHPNSLHHIDDDDEEDTAPAKPVSKPKKDTSNSLIEPAPLKDEDNKEE